MPVERKSAYLMGTLQTWSPEQHISRYKEEDIDERREV